MSSGDVNYHVTEKLRSLPADHCLTEERSNASFLTGSTTCSQILGPKKHDESMYRDGFCVKALLVASVPKLSVQNHLYRF